MNNLTELSSPALRSLENGLNILLDKDFDLDRFEKIGLLRQKEIDRIEKMQFISDLSKVQEKVGVVYQNKINPFLKNKYASLDKFIEQIRPVTSQNNFVVYFQIDGQTDSTVTVKIVAKHLTGNEISAVATVPIDSAGKDGRSNKSSLQALGSSITYARRYLIQLLFNLSSSEDDNDGNSIISMISDAQKNEIELLLEPSNSELSKVLASQKVNEINDLTSTQADFVIGLLKTKIKRIEQKQGD